MINDKKENIKNSINNRVDIIKCPSCGASLHPSENSNIIKCTYCESVSLLKNENGTIKVDIIEKPKKEIENANEEKSENTYTTIKAKNLNVYWKQTIRATCTALAIVVLGYATANIIKSKSNIVPTKNDKTISTESESNNKKTVREIVESIYGNEIEVDDKFVNAYINTVCNGLEENGNSMSKKYNPDSVIEDRNDLFELTEWIPTLEEVQSNNVKAKQR